MDNDQAVERLTRKSHISEVVLQPNEDEMTIQFVNTDASVMNALRRVVISEVPTMAIETVQVRENTSPLSGEYISHRLGLVPLVSDNVDSFEYSKDCPEIDCDRCRVKFSLKVTNDSPADIDVTSNHLTSTEGNPYRVYPIHHPALTATSSNSMMSHNPDDVTDKNPVVIAKLACGQTIDLDCVALKGIGKDHAKWSPVCCSVFRYTPVVFVNEDEAAKLSGELREKFDEVCPRNIIKMERDLDGNCTGRVVLGDTKGCNYCNECIQFASINKVPDLVRVEDRPGMFEYYVESTGVMPPEKIVSSAFGVIIDKLKNIKTALNEQ